MYKLPKLSEIDLGRFDPRNVELPKFELPKFELPKFELPKFELPKVDLPKVDLPKVEIDVDRIAGFARDAAYVGIGAVVISAQKAEERRREVTEQVTSGVKKLVDAVR